MGTVVIHIIHNRTTVIRNHYDNLSTIAELYPALVDQTRLDKALSIVQDPYRLEKVETEYLTTTTGCGCKDWENRAEPNRKTADGKPYPGPCKHILAKMLLGE